MNFCTSRLIIISLCIALHFFNGVGIFYSHPFSKHLHIFRDTDFLDISTKFLFLLRILGSYCLGKIADKIGFFKVMKIICLIYIIASALLLFCNNSNTFASTVIICTVHGLLAFLRVGSFILPATYIIRNYPKLKYYSRSALVWTSCICGITLANLFIGGLLAKSCINWNIVYVVISCLSLMIYSYIDTLSTDTSSQIEAKNVIISFPAFFLSLFLTGVLAVGITYQYFSVQQYAEDILILSGKQLIYSPFWLVILATVILTSRITKNLEAVTIFKISLIGLLCPVSIFFASHFVNYSVLFFCNVTFGFFFGLLLPRSLTLMYGILKGDNSYFYMSLVYGLGFSCFPLIAIYLEKLHFIPLYLLGSLLIALLISVCLLINKCYGVFNNVALVEKSAPLY